VCGVVNIISAGASVATSTVMRGVTSAAASVAVARSRPPSFDGDDGRRRCYIIWASGRRPQAWLWCLCPSEEDDQDGIECGGSWDPTLISGSEDPFEDELGVTGPPPVRTAPRPRSWWMMVASLDIVTLSEASSLRVSSFLSAWHE
jgi:hypothetical protein